MESDWNLIPLKVKNSERLEDDFKDSSPVDCRLQQNLLQFYLFTFYSWVNTSFPPNFVVLKKILPYFY